jgi:meso-butanediol dehydrogenase / (S,S)-butanediol dehydrogenase / diacetyl reductase
MLLENRIIFLRARAAELVASARACAVEGPKVVVTDVDMHNAEESGSDSIATHCNIADGVSVQSAVSTAISHFGRIDAMHNNAGIASPSKALDETSEEEWDRLMSVNLKSLYWTAGAAVPVFLLSEKAQFVTGCILPVSSGAELGYRR